MSPSAERPAGDSQAQSKVSRERLIEAHLPLVRTVARRFLGRGEDLEDLLQVGAIGLIKAAERFDAARGIRFATFANALIEGEIRRHLRDRAGTVRIPRKLQRTGAEVRRCGEQLARTLGRSPTAREIAVALDTDEREVERAVAAEGGADTIPITSGEGEQLPSAESSASLLRSDDRLLLASTARVLDDRERRIVLLRFHADMTEREIAREVGISQAHVSRLLGRALAKLRHELRSPEKPDESPDIGADAVVSPDPAPRIAGMVAPEESSSSARPVGPSKRRASSGYSGRFLVRMPSELHEQLARAAERDHVSLNRYVTDALTASVASPPPTERTVVGSPAEGEAVRNQDPIETVATADGRSNAPRTLRVALATNLVVVVLAGFIALTLLVLGLERGI